LAPLDHEIEFHNVNLAHAALPSLRGIYVAVRHFGLYLSQGAQPRRLSRRRSGVPRQ